MLPPQEFLLKLASDDSRWRLLRVKSTMDDPDQTVKQTLVNVAFTLPSSRDDSRGESCRGSSGHDDGDDEDDGGGGSGGGSRGGRDGSNGGDGGTGNGGNDGDGGDGGGVNTNRGNGSIGIPAAQTYAEMTASGAFAAAAARVQKRDGMDPATVAAACELLSSPRIADAPITLIMEVQLYVPHFLNMRRFAHAFYKVRRIHN